MARTGRGRPASPLLRSASGQGNTRTGSLAGSGGGSVALSVAPVLNQITNPSFETDTSGWATSGFSLVSGAAISINDPGPLGFVAGVKIGQVDTFSTDQGANYAPTALGNFLPGIRYYAQITIAASFGGDLVELLLGSTSDDYASVQFHVTTSWQTVTISWVPQAIRTASDHGLAFRTKEVGTTANNSFYLDAAIIATSDGYWEGWRVGGKGGKAALAASGGGSSTITAGQAAAGALTGSCGGSSTLTTRKGGQAALAPSAGGSGVLTVTGAHAGSLAASAGGSGVLTELRALLLPPGGLFGGGGRVGRSHPAAGVVPRGVGATVTPFGRSGALTGSCGGSSTLATAKGGLLVTAGTVGGTPALTVSKGAIVALGVTAGGTAALVAGASTPSTGGIAGGFLIGGGGRVGRSHPAHSLTPATAVRFTAINFDARTGVLASSAGGGGTFTSRKGAISTTPADIPAPPPAFVTTLILAGLRASAGGSLTYAYTRTGQRVGSLTGTGGGSAAFTASKAITGPLTTFAGPQAVLGTRKGASGSVTGSADGDITYSFATFEARNGSLSTSAGGAGTFRASKQALAAATGSAGGQFTPRASKGSRGTLTTTAGGSLTYTYSTGGLAAIGALVGSCGGTGTLTTRKVVLGVTIHSSDGDRAEFARAKGGSGALGASTGGGGRFVRATSTAPILVGIVTPRRRLGRVSKDEHTGRSPVLRR